MFASYPVKRGTRNPAGGSEEPFICTGCSGATSDRLISLIWISMRRKVMRRMEGTKCSKVSQGNHDIIGV